MTQGNLTSFVLTQSGQPFNLPNGMNVASGGSLTVNYTPTGNPATLAIFIEGIKRATGECFLIDSYESTANAVARSVSLSDTFDSFRITPIWAGGSGVSVAASIAASGPGPSFDSTLLPAVQAYSV